MLRRALSLVLALGLGAAAFQAGCGDSVDGSTFPNGGLEEAGVSSGEPPGPFANDTDGATPPDADPDALGKLVVTPPTATVAVTIVGGVVTVNAPVQFTASYGGQPVTPTWLLDRGELGDVDANGLFKASGKNVGEGTITARFGAREGTAKIKVVVQWKDDGASAGADAGAGLGGQGGVGGEPIGGPVGATLATRLKTESNAPASAAELGFLYPYDKTVWPRGLLAPLLMWQTTHSADAVYVKLSQGNFTFEGTYSLAAQPAGDAKKRVRLEDGAWSMATNGNQGDDLKLEVKIHATDGDTVVGPITESWKVAPGVLKGTVYYNSYDSVLTTGGGAQSGGVIAIKPRSPNPSLAVPSQAGKCHVCHEVSADGSTLWAQDYSYSDGASYDLTKSPIPRNAYTTAANAQNNRKFVWAAPYPDGSFALASSHWAREAFTATDSMLFARADGAHVASTGFEGVVQDAVTPAFSPDGRKVAFNFWLGAGAGGVTAGNGHSLDVMDFDCGAAKGSVACGAGAKTFSNLREIYKDANRYPAWASFLPDASAVVFHNTLQPGTCGSNPPVYESASDPDAKLHNCTLTTWYSGTAELWWAKDAATKDARRLDAANGTGVVPTSADHPNDAVLNYQPTVNPVASGGYYWVVFTSRRMYGNLITGKPWGADGQSGGPIKKLWVAAIDVNAPATGDPSHPAFYLPGQEIDAGNTRGFWVVDPCKPNGTSCESGDECCNGFCRKDPDGGALVCMDKPPGTSCVQEFEKCTVDGDCCDPKQKCINNRCSLGSPVIK